MFVQERKKLYALKLRSTYAQFTYAQLTLEIKKSLHGGRESNLRKSK